MIDLAASRLLAAGIVAELDIADLVPAGAERIDQISGLDLLVIKVGEYLDRRAFDGARDRIALRHGLHEHARLVHERVERPIGRTLCRTRRRQNVEFTVVAGQLKKKNKKS